MRAGASQQICVWNATRLTQKQREYLIFVCVYRFKTLPVIWSMELVTAAPLSFYSLICICSKQVTFPFHTGRFLVSANRNIVICQSCADANGKNKNFVRVVVSKAESLWNIAQGYFDISLSGLEKVCRQLGSVSRLNRFSLQVFLKNKWKLWGGSSLLFSVLMLRSVRFGYLWLVKLVNSSFF